MLWVSFVLESRFYLTLWRRGTSQHTPYPNWIGQISLQKEASHITSVPFTQEARTENQSKKIYCTCGSVAHHSSYYHTSYITLTTLCIQVSITSLHHQKQKTQSLECLNTLVCFDGCSACAETYVHKWRGLSAPSPNLKLSSAKK